MPFLRNIDFLPAGKTNYLLDIEWNPLNLPLYLGSFLVSLHVLPHPSAFFYLLGAPFVVV
jgi:hypothetical protein